MRMVYVNQGLTHGRCFRGYISDRSSHIQQDLSRENGWPDGFLPTLTVWVSLKAEETLQTYPVSFLPTSVIPPFQRLSSRLSFVIRLWYPNVLRPNSFTELSLLLLLPVERSLSSAISVSLSYRLNRATPHDFVPPFRLYATPLWNQEISTKIGFTSRSNGTMDRYTNTTIRFSTKLEILGLILR